LKVWGVEIESERKQRMVCDTLVTTEIVAEAAPFSFALKRGGEEIRSAPIAYIQHIAVKVMELLDQSHRYLILVLARTCKLLSLVIVYPFQHWETYVA